MLLATLLATLWPHHHAVAHAAVQLGAGGDAGKGHPAGDALGEEQQVGLRLCEVLVAPPHACAGHAALHLQHRMSQGEGSGQTHASATACLLRLPRPLCLLRLPCCHRALRKACPVSTGADPCTGSVARMRRRPSCLVKDEQHAVRVAQLPQLGQEAGGRGEEAALAKNRLDDDGRRLLRQGQVGRGGRGACWLIHRSSDLGTQGRL